jgi:hypothetical protein
MKKLIMLTGIFCLLFSESKAVDSSFWKPYEADEWTYCLNHFDKISKNEELLGGAKIVNLGKFSKALKLNGKDALKINNDKPFTGGIVSVEAWMKLEKYPDKKAYILYKPGEFKKSKFFALAINSDASIQLETTNCDRRKKQIYIVKSKQGVVPLNKWTHIAMIIAPFPKARRMLLVNGQEIICKNLEHGTGIFLFTEETQPTPFFIGNNADLSAGITGMIDELRVHQKLYQLWPEPEQKIARRISSKYPVLLKEHQPILYFPFDKNLEPELNKVKDLRIKENSSGFVNGIKGKAYCGNANFLANSLLNNKKGSIEFFFTPIGINRHDKGDKRILSGGRFLFGLRASGKTISWRITKSHDIWDGTKTEVYPGRWYHIVLTWQGNNRKLYVDGQEAARDSILTSIDSEFIKELKLDLCKDKPVFAVDELYLYDECLTEEEAENLYNRYFHPKKITTPEELHLFLTARYFPSERKIIAQVKPFEKRTGAEKVKFILLKKKHGSVFETTTDLSSDDIILNIPKLADGTYCLKTYLIAENKRKLAGEKFYFKHLNFPWLGNKLGITDKVEKPFIPLKIEGKNVSMWARTYEMNGFGLWNKVISKGKNILAQPVTLKCESDSKILNWNFGKNGFTSHNESKAVFTSEASCEAVKIQTVSTIEFDGCMRVDMRLSPGQEALNINKLWLEMPVNIKDAPLFHLWEIGKHSYAGKSPEGKGLVWDSSKAKRQPGWLNYFTPYIWLGGAERGICWFGENDKGWITKKLPGKSVLQEIYRDNNELIFKIYFINKPTVLDKVHELTFGMQASPTKPMPENWRSKLDHAPGGLGVYPWGGLSCSYKTPYQNDWSIIDKTVEARQTGKVDEKWFRDYAENISRQKFMEKWIGWLRFCEKPV